MCSLPGSPLLSGQRSCQTWLKQSKCRNIPPQPHSLPGNFGQPVFFFFFCLKILFYLPFISSLTYQLFRGVYFNVYIFVNFPVFLILFLVSYHCVQKKIFYMISIPSNLFRFVCSLTHEISQKNVCSAGICWNVLYMSVGLIWSKAQSSAMSLFKFFYLDDVSIDESG